MHIHTPRSVCKRILTTPSIHAPFTCTPLVTCAKGSYNANQSHGHSLRLRISTPTSSRPHSQIRCVFRVCRRTHTTPSSTSRLLPTSRSELDRTSSPDSTRISSTTRRAFCYPPPAPAHPVRLTSSLPSPFNIPLSIRLDSYQFDHQARRITFRMPSPATHTLYSPSVLPPVRPRRRDPHHRDGRPSHHPPSLTHTPYPNQFPPPTHPPTHPPTPLPPLPARLRRRDTHN
jgi:hypothetical protein